MIKFKSYSIQTKIMTFFISLAVILFITVGLLFFRSTEYAINSSKKNELKTLSFETSNKIDRFMFERYGDIQVMADSPLLKNDGIDKSLKYQYLKSVMNAYKTYDYIFVTNAKGNIGELSGNLNGDNEYKNWIKKVLSGKIYISDFTRIDDNNYVVYFAAPIIRNNIVIGAVVERMNFNAISDIVRNVKIGKKGYAYLLSGSGAVMLEPSNVTSNLKIKSDTSALNTINVEHNGVKYVSAFYPIKKYDTQKSNWYLVVEEASSEAFQIAYNLRNYTIIIIFISVFALFVLAIIMSEIITKPIKKLVMEAQNIVSGNLRYNIDIESSDEIGSLAHSFNALLNNLKSMMQQVLDISGEAASLAEVRQYADRFFENIPSAIITIDNTGTITAFNNVAEEITGIAGGSIIGDNIRQVNASCISNLEGLLIDGIERQVIYIKHIVKIKDIKGEEIPIMITTSIQRDANQNVIGIIGAFKKVEEIKLLEDSVVRAKNLASLGALSAGMAHEIRNPLTSIKGYAQFIKSELGDGNELSPDVAIIINEVDRLNGILDRFLTFAHPKQLKLKPTSINEISIDIVKLISMEIPDNIRILADYGDVPLIPLDPEQMEQAILNLVLNSIQAMPGGGDLSISTSYEKSSDYVEVVISDTGVGISPEDYDNIFEPFFTTKDKGTGLGLAICSRIIEDHKGFIEVSSTLGLGTQFTIKLPVKD